MWAVAAHWAFTGSHSFLRASSQLQDTQCSWPRARVAYSGAVSTEQKGRGFMLSGVKGSAGSLCQPLM